MVPLRSANVFLKRASASALEKYCWLSTMFPMASVRSIAARCSARHVVGQIYRHRRRVAPFARETLEVRCRDEEDAEHEQRDGNRGRRQRARLPSSPQAEHGFVERVAQRAHQATSTTRPCSSVIDAAAHASYQLAIVRRDDDGRAARVDLAKQIHDFERQVRDRGCRSARRRARAAAR